VPSRQRSGVAGVLAADRQHALDRVGGAQRARQGRRDLQPHHREGLLEPSRRLAAAPGWVLSSSRASAASCASASRAEGRGRGAHPAGRPGRAAARAACRARYRLMWPLCTVQRCITASSPNRLRTALASALAPSIATSSPLRRPGLGPAGRRAGGGHGRVLGRALPPSCRQLIAARTTDQARQTEQPSRPPNRTNGD
jgi:hypothetical protein